MHESNEVQGMRVGNRAVLCSVLRVEFDCSLHVLTHAYVRSHTC